MSTVIVIPARLASTRLPEKPLADICGKPMVQHVYERAKKVKGVDRVVVATDNEKIMSVVKSFGGEVIMTSPDLQSGTDRVAAVAEKFPEGKIFINMQGDEPMMDPKNVEATLELVKSGKFKLATCASSLKDEEALKNPNIVKVLVAQDSKAVYFSRFPIPYSRAAMNLSDAQIPLHHQGLYVFDRATLLQFAKLPRTTWEVAESLEQLRALYHGISIGVAKVSSLSLGVDTPEDLNLMRKLLKS